MEIREAKTWLEGTVRNLVDQEARVDIAEFGDNDVTLFKVKVAPEDNGKVIGRQGRNIKAINTLMKALSTKHQRMYKLEFIETKGRG